MNIEDLTTFERWQYLAAFLPFVVSVIIQRGWTKETQTRAAIVVYVIWGLFGALISGEFVGLTFDTALNVADSVMMVIIVGFVSYQTLWKAFPLPDRLEAATGGDPLVQVRPNQNVA